MLCRRNLDSAIFLLLVFVLFYHAINNLVWKRTTTPISQAATLTSIPIFHL